jgi:hypothetical protein
MNKSNLLALSLLALFACGDDKVKPDAAIHHDAPNPDAPSIPSPPTPGAQIDRMGRPAINTALNHTFDAACTAATCPAKDTYNQDSAAGSWTTTYLTEFTGNLPFFDFLDTGLTCTAGNCSVQTVATSGCGNQLLYNGNVAGGSAAATCPGAGCSYNTFATVAADDQLYVDTSKGTCSLYLAVELGAVAPALAIADCGGRTLTEDVIDVTYTAVSTGLSGFSATFDPAVKDGAGPHTDVTTTFPYLGPPHSPN